MLNLSGEKKARLEWQADALAGELLIPSEHLAREVKRHLPGMRQMQQTALENGIDESVAADFFWDRLAEKVSQVFQVSAEAVEKQLKFHNMEPKNIFE